MISKEFRSIKIASLAVKMKLKNQLKHLAIFGGVPAFREQLHVGRPNIGNRDRFLERFHWCKTLHCNI